MQTNPRPAPDALFELVCERLLELEIEGVDRGSIELASDLVADLGMDSLKFVDLTSALEEALCVERFPMQEWVDAQIEREQALTVESLVAACRDVLADAGADRHA